MRLSTSCKKSYFSLGKTLVAQRHPIQCFVRAEFILFFKVEISPNQIVLAMPRICLRKNFMTLFWLVFVSLSSRTFVRKGEFAPFWVAEKMELPVSFCCQHGRYWFLINSRENGLSWWLRGKETTCNAGDTSLIPGSGRSPGGGNGNPFWRSCLEKSMKRRAWWAAVHELARGLDMT